MNLKGLTRGFFTFLLAAIALTMPVRAQEKRVFAQEDKPPVFYVLDRTGDDKVGNGVVTSFVTAMAGAGAQVVKTTDEPNADQPTATEFRVLAVSSEKGTSILVVAVQHIQGADLVLYIAAGVIPNVTEDKAIDVGESLFEFSVQVYEHVQTLGDEMQHFPTVTPTPAPPANTPAEPAKPSSYKNDKSTRA